jgi:hypothetical protein
MAEMEFLFHDERLNRRAQLCFSKLAESPAESFPQVFSRSDQLQGFYRFINNDRVDIKSLIDSVTNQSRLNMTGSLEAIAIHDTTHVNPSGKNIEVFEKGGGFFAHLSLLVNSANLKQIYGAGGLHIWARPKHKKVGAKSERDCWFDQVDVVENEFPEVSLLHVMDREGDMCALWSEMIDKKYRFVIRAKFNRHAKTDTGDASRVFDEIYKVKPVAHREVTLSKRLGSEMPQSKKAHPPRAKRKVSLRIAAKTIEVHKTDRHGHTTPETVKLNVVRVFENSQKPDAIEWILMTSEPIADVKQILRVVDIYKARWIIEEFFKALKTGCSLEERLLADAESWYRLTTFLLPLAANIMNLRLNKEATDERIVLNEIHWNILRASAKSLNRNLENFSDALHEIARLGGHIAGNDRPPGWITLLRGYKKLIEMEFGWRLAQGKM